MMVNLMYRSARGLAPRCFLICLLLAGHAFAAAPAPTPKDKCAVCGMFVAKFTDWLAVVEFADGTRAYFDGPKDMFKYILDLKVYRKALDAPSAITVTEYYDLKPIDARKAFYVLGSDVYGPMGHELIPFKSEPDAREFMADHKGTRVIKFDEVTLKLVEGL